MKRTIIITLAAALLMALALPAMAGPRHRAAQLDRKGDRIEQRLNRAALRAAHRGNWHKAIRLRHKGVRINKRLDRKASRSMYR